MRFKAKLKKLEHRELTLTSDADISGIIKKGDINNDKAVNLTDLLVALKTLADLPTAGEIRANYADSGADIGGNGVIGFEEVFFILREMSGIKR